MQTVEQWLEEWNELNEPLAQKAFFDKTSKELLDNPQIKAIYSIWNVRYYYVDKKKTRLGDKFIWLFLAMRGQTKNSVGLKEFLRIYRDIFGNKDSQAVLTLYPEELYRQLLGAASLYVGTIGDPPPLLGLIPQKDKTPLDRMKRVADQIMNEHIETIWRAEEKMDNAKTIISALYEAAESSGKGMKDELELSFKKHKSDKFRAWLEQLEIFK